MTDKTVWLECKCSVPEHAVRVSLAKWGGREDDVELWIEPQLRLADVGFFKRVWWAIKILFGYDPACFTECIVSEESLDELSTIIVSYRLIRKLRKAREGKSSR